MKFQKAADYAVQAMEWLRPYCVRLEVAGSIRRCRPECADVDIVCIPSLWEEVDMFGEVSGRRNLVWEFLRRFVAQSEGKVHFDVGGEHEGKQVILQLPKFQLDLWFADERTWATRLLCRTGSMKHNIWLATIARDLGLHWNPYEGIEGKDCSTEESIYAALGLKFLPPKEREK